MNATNVTAAAGAHDYRISTAYYVSAAVIIAANAAVLVTLKKHSFSSLSDSMVIILASMAVTDQLVGFAMVASITLSMLKMNSNKISCKFMAFFMYLGPQLSSYQVGKFTVIERFSPKNIVPPFIP